LDKLQGARYKVKSAKLVKLNIKCWESQGDFFQTTKSVVALRSINYIMSDSQFSSSDLSSSRHIIPVDPDGPEVDTEDFLEELDGYQEQFENDHFEALQRGEYIAGYDPLDSSLVEILVRYTCLSMVQLPNNVRYAITQLSLQFEQILTSNTLELEVRRLLGYMQVPLLRMAILDEKFIENINNSAVRLFYKLSDVAALWLPSDNVLTDTLYRQLADVIAKVRDKEELTFKFCEEQLSELIAISSSSSGAAVQQETTATEEDETAEAVVEEAPEESAEEKDPLMDLVEKINVGVRLEYFDGETTHKLKVAAVLPSNGEIVLVDRNQEKFGSFDRGDVYESIKDGMMVIDEETLQYNQTLESVIGNLRK